MMSTNISAFPFAETAAAKALGEDPSPRKSNSSMSRSTAPLNPITTRTPLHQPSPYKARNPHHTLLQRHYQPSNSQNHKFLIGAEYARVGKLLTELGSKDGDLNYNRLAKQQQELDEMHRRRLLKTQHLEKLERRVAADRDTLGPGNSADETIHIRKQSHPEQWIVPNNGPQEKNRHNVQHDMMSMHVIEEDTFLVSKKKHKRGETNESNRTDSSSRTRRNRGKRSHEIRNPQYDVNNEQLPPMDLEFSNPDGPDIFDADDDDDGMLFPPEDEVNYNDEQMENPGASGNDGGAITIQEVSFSDPAASTVSDIARGTPIENNAIDFKKASSHLQQRQQQQKEQQSQSSSSSSTTNAAVSPTTNHINLPDAESSANRGHVSSSRLDSKKQRKRRTRKSKRNRTKKKLPHGSFLPRLKEDKRRRQRRSNKTQTQPNPLAALKAFDNSAGTLYKTINTLSKHNNLDDFSLLEYNLDIVPAVENAKRKKLQIKSKNYKSFQARGAKAFTPYRYFTNYRAAVEYVQDEGLYGKGMTTA